jgi:DNA helicase HerA-like ATPase
MAGWEFPSITEKVLVVGSTGSGKSTLGLWMLKHAPFHRMPYVMVDYKREDAIKMIDRARQIDFTEIPRHPGLYVIRPMPDVDDDRMSGWLYGVWNRGNTGLFFDEGMMVPKSGALQAIYTQGRSKRIPAITLSQRPVSLHRTALSESDHFVVFRLNDERDYKTVLQYVPRVSEQVIEDRPEYNSLWYRQRDRAKWNFERIDNPESIPGEINSRLPRRVFFI